MPNAVMELLLVALGIFTLSDEPTMPLRSDLDEMIDR